MAARVWSWLVAWGAVERPATSSCPGWVVGVVGAGGGLWIPGGSAGRRSGGLGIRAMSSKMDLLTVGVRMGVYLLRNFLLQSDCLPDPSSLIKYWWNWHTSTMEPVLSHLSGWLPV